MSGLEDLFDDEEAYKLDYALQVARDKHWEVFAFNAARTRVQVALTFRAQPFVRTAFGLSRIFTRLSMRDTSAPVVPLGWRARRMADCDCVAIMPLWLYWLVELWARRYEIVFRPLIWLKLWRVREGDYWWKGRWTCPRPIKRFVWCFLNDADHYPSITVRVAPGTMTRMPNRRAFIEWAEKQFGPMGGTWGLSSTTYPENHVG